MNDRRSVGGGVVGGVHLLYFISNSGCCDEAFPLYKADLTKGDGEGQRRRKENRGRATPVAVPSHMSFDRMGPCEVKECFLFQRSPLEDPMGVCVSVPMCVCV